MDQSSDLKILFIDDGVPAVISQSGKTDRPTTVLFNLNSLDLTGVQTDKPGIVIPTEDLDGFDLKLAAITVIGKYPVARMTKPDSDGDGLTTALLQRV